MANDDVRAPDSMKHLGTHGAGVSSFRFPEHVLAAATDIAVPWGFPPRGKGEKGGEKNTSISSMPRHIWKKCRDKCLRLLRCFIQLPVCGNQFFSHASALIL